MSKKFTNTDIITTGSVQASEVTGGTLTDGTATLSGGALLAQNVLVSDILGVGTLRSNSNNLNVINSHGDSDGANDTEPFVMSLQRPAQASGAIQIIEENETTGAIAGARLAYQGDSSEDLGVSNPKLTFNVSSLQAINKADSDSEQTAHNVLSFGATGNAVRLESSDDLDLVATDQVSFDTKSVIISPSTDSDNLPASLKLLRTNPMGSSTVELLSEDTNSDRYGIRLSFEGTSTEDVGVPTFNGALQAVREVSGDVEPISNVIRFSNTGGNVQMASTDTLDLTAQTTLTMNATGAVSIASEDQITVGDNNSPVTLQSGTNDLSVYGGGTRIVAGLGGHEVISATSISLQASVIGKTSLELSENNITLEARDVSFTIPDGTARQGRGLSIDGGKFSLGNPRGDFLTRRGLEIFVPYLDETEVNSYSFGDTKSYIVSDGDLVLATRQSHQDIAWGYKETASVSADGDIASPDDIGSIRMRLNMEGTGAGLYIDGGVQTGAATMPFTGAHVYQSDLEITSGSAVILEGNSLILSPVAGATNCVGVVISCYLYSSIPTVYRTNSLDSMLTESGYCVKVASVGDSRTRGCQGFNVCNENGDIQPGDLLVTSSTPGYLMKQDDDIIRSKTVGKAMEAVTFDDNGQATGVYGFIYCG